MRTEDIIFIVLMIVGAIVLIWKLPNEHKSKTAKAIDAVDVPEEKNDISQGPKYLVYNTRWLFNSPVAMFPPSQAAGFTGS